MKFSTTYGFTYTFEQDVVENPFSATEFPGVRLAYDFWWLLTKTAEFNSDLIVDFNLDNTEDIRIDVVNSFPIKISEKLLFEPQTRILWRNDPALQEVPLFDMGGTQTGSVFVPLKKTDLVFTLALVLKI